MRLLAIVLATLVTLGLAAFGVVVTRHASEQDSGAPAAKITRNSSAPAASPQTATAPIAVSSQAPAAARSTEPPLAGTAAGSGQPRQAQDTGSKPPVAALADTAAVGRAKATHSSIPACDKPDGLGLTRIVQIDTTGGPVFGLGHFEHYEFLRDKEVVLTFDGGPRPGTTASVLQALADNCLKATFFELGERATRYPEIVKQVAAAGHTIGTYTWSYKDLANRPYNTDLDAAKTEIEMGFSAVRMAAGAPIAPFFRFPDFREPPKLLPYFAERNIAVFSTDIDSFDFKLHRPKQIIETVMDKLKKRGNGIILMQDSEIATAQALPELLRQLKVNGYKVVHMVPKAPVTTLAKYDAMVRQNDKIDVTNTHPASSVVKTINGD
jgi:peptidoglycan/xylan/chitin deacetylase (PgdA/CDA1 family)